MAQPPSVAFWVKMSSVAEPMRPADFRGWAKAMPAKGEMGPTSNRSMLPTSIALLFIGASGRRRWMTSNSWRRSPTMIRSPSRAFAISMRREMCCWMSCSANSSAASPASSPKADTSNPERSIMTPPPRKSGQARSKSNSLGTVPLMESVTPLTMRRGNSSEA